MVQAVNRWNDQNESHIDLVLCVGDFTACRDEYDQWAVACPAKYQRPGDFPDYYHDRKKFPAEVIFIGGNHEAYNWLDTKREGGNLNADCYYMGRWGLIERCGLRIAGLSGIFSPKWYKVEPEVVDYKDLAVLSSYKIKKKATYFTKTDVRALSGIDAVDLMMLHDWPSDLPRLIRTGSEDGKARNGVGNKPSRLLLENLKPRWLFCGHMHQYYRGDIHWSPKRISTVVCLNQINQSHSPYLSIIDVERGTCRTVHPRELES